ncbi:O-antigen translocase [Shewanella sp. DW31]|uniref:O-antigen translocase n=1 Tax=Shewanella sp. DW31 TaxID=2699422 RepID=UPI0018E36FED|nr:O-antigen translocase [Shewanella sp. DW31]MBI1674391.1 O-antigen translocase [Shewanella sp. DW31]
MNLAKTSLLSLIVTSIKLLSNLIVNKAIAILIGPVGLVYIGNLQNALLLITTLAQGGINIGVTKYTAEFSCGAEQQRINLLSTSFKITFFLTILISLCLLFFSSELSILVFMKVEYSYIFVTLSIFLILSSLNQLFISVINGLKEVKLFMLISAAQSFYTLLSTLFFLYLWGIEGVLINLVTSQSVIFIFVAIYFVKYNSINFSFEQIFRYNFDKIIASKLFKFSLMTLVTAILAPSSLFIIRNYLSTNLTLNDAGIWQGLISISNMYLLVVTTALTSYYLPKLSSTSDGVDLKVEFFAAFKFFIPLVSLIAVVVYFLKDLLVFILFSEDFAPMLPLFKWQLIGDVIKISSWLCSFIILAKAKVKIYVITEIFLYTLYTLTSVIMVSFFGLIGTVYAFALVYSIYFVCMLLIVNFVFFK